MMLRRHPALSPCRHLIHTKPSALVCAYVPFGAPGTSVREAGSSRGSFLDEQHPAWAERGHHSLPWEPLLGEPATSQPPQCSGERGSRV